MLMTESICMYVSMFVHTVMAKTFARVGLLLYIIKDVKKPLLYVWWYCLVGRTVEMDIYILL